ncbi:MAG: ribonuclease T2 [Acidobacteriaceae bacterium]
MQPRYLAIIALFCLALSGCRPPSPAQSHPEATRDPRSASESRRQSPRPTDAATAPGVFDFYLLNLSWSPEFCATHPAKPECAQHLGFVLHGLWPQTNNGGHPELCSNLPGPSDPSAFQDIYPDLGLLQHEWQVHGTCSGLSPDAFFRLARQAVHTIAIPGQLTGLNHQVSMPPAAILDLFTAANPALPRASLALTCGNNNLTAVELCLAKDLSPIACQQVRSCRANTVRIPPPNTAP